MDAQGHDLKVIKSLKSFRNCLMEGVAEVPSEDKLKMYEKEQSFKDLKKKFKEWKFNIISIEEVQKNYPSFNVYFKNNNSNVTLINKINFKSPSKRFGRMFKRIFLEKTNLKDFIYSLFWKFIINKNIIK